MRQLRIWSTGLTIAACVTTFAFPATKTHAAGGAYQVDTAEIASPGNCKIEAWTSYADNRDSFSAINPSCAMYFLRPIELGAQFAHYRMDGEWNTAVAPKIKVNLIPGEIGKFGVALVGQAAVDMITGEVIGYSAYIPATMRVSENVRFNVDVGYIYDRTAQKNFLTYGLGIDVRTADNVWTLTAETFGLLNDTSKDPQVQPRFQVGLRYRPIDRVSFDVIYGRNLYGESANWVTLATIIRFPAENEKDKQK